MENLTKQQEKQLVTRMAKEFLEYRLGIKATDENVRCFSRHLEDFEKQIQQKEIASKMNSSCLVMMA